MDVVILSSSPNTDGLTAACAAAVAVGLKKAGVGFTEVRLTDADIGVCQQCDNGWGTCRNENFCKVEDGFQPLHQRVIKADALAIVTPVYFGEFSESMKAFIDRLRRCEAKKPDRNPLGGRWLLGVAAAGGGGGGTVSCMEQIERFVAHVGMKRFDLIGITRWTRTNQLLAIESSARALGEAMTGTLIGTPGH